MTEEQLVKKREADKRYYLNNTETCRVKRKAYYEANKEKVLSRAREKYSLDSAPILERNRRYQVENKETVQRCAKRWRDKNKFYLINRHREFRKLIIDFLGGNCVRCGYDADIRALQLDHIHGDGASDRKKGGGPCITWYKKLLLDPETPNKFQVLCANCNFIKRDEELGFGPEAYI